MDCEFLGRYIGLYLDGELALEERVEIESHLRVCEKCREATSREARIRSFIRQSLLDVRAPRSLRDHISSTILDQTRAENHRVLLVAAVAVFVVVGAGYLAFTVQHHDPTAVAIAVHQETSDTEIIGTRQQVADFLASHAPFSTRIPLEDHEGLRLIGARVTKLGDQPAVVFFYDAEGQRVSIAQYPTREGEEPNLVVGNRDGFTVVTWGDRNLTHTVVSNSQDVKRFIPASYGVK